MASSATYKKIAQLAIGDKDVSVFGVVTVFTPPMKSKGNDHYCRVRIADETSPQFQLTCLLFNHHSDKLPQASQCSVGDVICLHRISVTNFNNKPQGVMYSISDGKWVVFRRREGSGLEHKTAPGQNVIVTGGEKERALQLMEWGNGFTTSKQSEGLPPPPMVKIRDIRQGDRGLNVCGLVQHLKPPTKTKTGNYFSSLVIMDETSPPETLTTVFFASLEAGLPYVCSKGDVMLIKGLRFSSYNHFLQGTGYEDSCTAVCISGHPSSNLKPRVSSGQSCSLSQEEEKRVKELKEWGLTQPGVQLKDRNCCFKNVVPNKPFDITCQVVATMYNRLKRQCVLTVWDGTELSLPCRKVDTSGNLYETQTSMNQGHLIQSLSQDVIINGADTVGVLPGDFARLINVCATSSLDTSLPEGGHPTVELGIQKDSFYGGGVVVLHEQEVEVKELKKQLPILNSEFRKLKRFLLPSATEVIEPHAKRAAPIRKIREDAEVPQVFLAKVKVMKVAPQHIEDFCELRCPECHYKFTSVVAGSSCQHCIEDRPGTHPPQLKFTYSFSLHVQDSTGELEVYVSADDAEKFMPELPPADLCTNSHARDALLDRLYYITGGNDPFVDISDQLEQPRPWLDCCIMSYQSCTNCIRYRITDTVLCEWDL